MPNNRIDAVVSAIVGGIRDAVAEHNVTFEEYRQGIGYIMKTAEAGELPLLIDLFMNATIVGNVNRNAKPGTSPADLEGPYFIEDVPEVTGKLKVLDDDRCEPLLLRGVVRDLSGKPLPGATVFVWSSTHDGKYGGIHDGLPTDLYRGKLTTDAQGRYEVETRVPVPYHIPNSGPVGALLQMMRRHSWRPAHVHYKIRHVGYQELITQVYFEGGAYVNDDCCEGIVPPEFVKPVVRENGRVVLDVDFSIEPARAPAFA
jgi:chlorocatechol 1,2-dioxygenase